MPTRDPVKRREYNRRYYHESSGKARISARNKANKRAKVEYVRSLKAAGSCVDCGGSFPPVAMQYDHTGTDKIKSVSQLAIEGASIERIDAEIAKCDLVCANCHAVRTAGRR